MPQELRLYLPLREGATFDPCQEKHAASEAPRGPVA